MYQRQYSARQLMKRAITLVVIISQMAISGIAFSQPQLLSPALQPADNAFICGQDFNGDGQWTQQGETATCVTGSRYSAEQAHQTGNGYISNPPSYSCPIGQVSCNQQNAYFCPFDGKRCTDGATSCSKSQHCQPFQQSFEDSQACSTDSKIVATACTSISKQIDDIVVKGSSCPVTGLQYWQDGPAGADHNNVCAAACSQPVDYYTCPLTHHQYDSLNQCTQDCWQLNSREKYRCPLTGVESNDVNQCNATCSETQVCSVEKSFSCPLSDSGNQYACINLDASNNSDNFVCAKPACGQYSNNHQDNETDTGIYIDDGDYDEDGMCLGQVMIFGGRAMDCRTPGISSAYQDCCAKDDGEIYYDSMGSLMDSYSYMEAITTAYEAAVVAYNAYSAGATAAEAATAASDFLATSFDPTTMAITVAVMLIMNYLEKACPPDDIETAIMDASGFCVDLGLVCSKKWFGNCVQEVKVKCCFSSKLARIIHQQGRPQLGLDFGTADEPNCRGFDAEEFQSLDFSKIDLSDYYDDLRKKNQTDIHNDLSDTITNRVGGQ